MKGNVHPLLSIIQNYLDVSFFCYIMMSTAELSEALSFRLQQLERSESEIQFQKNEQQERDDESRRLFELAIRIYCHRLGGDIYSNGFEVILENNFIVVKFKRVNIFDG